MTPGPLASPNPTSSTARTDDLWRACQAQPWDGRPPNPERDGWHLLRHALAHPSRVEGVFWQAERQLWWWSAGSAGPAATRSGFFYIQPWEPHEGR